MWGCAYPDLPPGFECPLDQVHTVCRIRYAASFPPEDEEPVVQTAVYQPGREPHPCTYTTDVDQRF